MNWGLRDKCDKCVLKLLISCGTTPSLTLCPPLSWNYIISTNSQSTHENLHLKGSVLEVVICASQDVDLRETGHFG